MIEHLDFQSKTAEFLNFLNFLRKSEFYPDFDVIVGENTFKCHKIIIAARSTKLRQLIQGGTSEYRCLSVVDSSSAEMVLSSIYSGQLDTNTSDFKSYVPLILELGLDDLISVCSKQLASVELNESNWTEYLHLAVRYSLDELQQHCREYFREECEKFLQNKALLSLDLDILLWLLDDNDLLVEDERVLLTGVLEWLNQSEERQLLCGDVFHVVRVLQIDLTPQDYIHWKKERVFQTAEGECLLDSMLKYCYDPSTRWELCGSQSRCRKGHLMQECLVAFEVVAGRSRTCLWNSEKKIWIRVFNSSVSMSDDIIGVIHGKQMFIFDATTAKGYVSQETFLDQLDTACGADTAGNGPTKDLFAEKWDTLLNPQTIKRLVAAVVELNSIIVIGASSPETSGSASSSSTWCNVVEQYVLRSNSWNPVAPLPFPVKRPLLFCCSQKVYVIEGEASTVKNTRQVQILKLDTMTWNVIDEDIFPSATTLHGAVCYDGVVYVDLGDWLAVLDLVTLELTRIDSLRPAKSPKRSMVVLAGCIVIVDADELIVLNPDSKKLNVLSNERVGANYVSFVLGMRKSCLHKVVGTARSTLSQVQPCPNGEDPLSCDEQSDQPPAVENSETKRKTPAALLSVDISTSQRADPSESPLKPTLVAMSKDGYLSSIWSVGKQSWVDVKNAAISKNTSVWHTLRLNSLSAQCMSVAVLEDHAYLFGEKNSTLEIYKAKLRKGVLTGLWEQVPVPVSCHGNPFSSIHSVVVDERTICVIAFFSVFLFTPSRNEFREIAKLLFLPESPCVFMLNPNELCILGGITAFGSETRKMFVWLFDQKKLVKVDGVLWKDAAKTGILSVMWKKRVFLTLSDCIATINENYHIIPLVPVNEDRRFGSMITLNDRILIMSRNSPSAWQFDPAKRIMLQSIEVKSVDGFYWVINLPEDELASV